MPSERLSRSQALIVSRRELAPALTESLEAALLRAWNRLSPGSRTVYARDWRRWTDYLQTRNLPDPLQAHPKHVEAWLTCLRNLELAPTSQARMLAVVKSIYAELARQGLLQANPARESRVRGARQTSNTPYLSPGELDRLLALPASTWAERRDRAIVWLAAGTGIRRESIAGVQAHDLRPVWGPELFARTPGQATTLVVRRAKGGKRYEFGVPRAVWIEVATWREAIGVEGEYPLFPTAAGALNRPMTVRAVWASVKDAMRRAGVEDYEHRGTVHALRRTFATEVYRRTKREDRPVVLREIQKALGHKHLAQTERYVQLAIAGESVPGEILFKRQG